MGNKGNLGCLIIFLALLVAVVAMATEHRPFERTKGINGLEKLIIRDRRGRSVEVRFLSDCTEQPDPRVFLAFAKF